MTGRLPRILVLISFAGIGVGAVAQENKLPKHDEGWWQQVAASIAESEYHINRGTAEFGQAALQAVNRAQNLRAEFSATGVTVTSRTENDAGWSLKLSLVGLEQHGALVPASIAERKSEDRTVTYFRGHIVESYTNEKSGILLNVDLSGSAVLNENSALAFELDTNLEAVVGNNGTQIEFYSDGMRVARISLRAPPSDGGGMPTALLYGNRLLIVAPQSARASNRVHMALTTTAGEDTQVGPSTTPDWVLNEEQPGSNFALSVAAAGDVNGDGFSDVIVGAPDYDVGQRASAGRALLYLGSAAGLRTTPSWSADGTVNNERFGEAVASAGNVNRCTNNDGFYDVIVGAPGSNSAYVYAGDDTGLQDTPWRIDGNSGDFGSSVAPAGRVNNDLCDDVIIGAPNDASGGRAEVHFGPLDSGPGFVELSVAKQTLCRPQENDISNIDCSQNDEAPFARFGHSVASAGDVDGDGYSDIVVGAPHYRFSVATDQCVQTGGAFVYLGGPLGSLQPGPPTIEADWCAAPRESSDLRLNGNFFAEIGSSVAAGDFNADGYDDILIGAPKWNFQRNFGDGDATFSNVGAALVYLSCESSNPPAGNCSSPRDTSLMSLNWAAIGILNDNNEKRIRFGAAVAAGDVNGDAVADVIVGAPDQDSNSVSTSISSGGAYVYLGSTHRQFLTIAESSLLQDIFGSGANTESNIAIRGTAQWFIEGAQRSGNLGSVVSVAGDIDGDGFSDMLMAEQGEASVYRAAGFLPGGELGWLSDNNLVAFVGDVNGDGFDDVAKRGQNIRVYSGTANRPLSDLDWILRSSNGDEVISGAGDVNGDGFADIIVGRPSANAVEIYAGPDPNPNNSCEISILSEEFGAAVASAGDVNGDGFSDVIVGDPSFNNFAGKVWVLLGAKTDDGSVICPSEPQWSREGRIAGSKFGHSVASAGDINADGYSDVIVGAPGDGTNDPGETFVFLGSLLTPLEANSWTARGSGKPGSEFGASVASAGDVNGDGFGDVVIGAPGTDLFDEADSDFGQVFAYLGSEAGLAVVEAWSFDGLESGDRLGDTVGNAGDVNGDGRSDVTVAYHNMVDEDFNGTPDQVTSGYVFLGAIHGLSSSPAWPPTGVILDGQTEAGTSMGGGGDYNGDGFSDFLVGGIGPILGNFSLRQNVDRSGIRRVPQQLQVSGEVIAPLGASTGTSFQIRVRRPEAPGRYGLEWEIKSLGTPFDGSGLQRGALIDYGGLSGSTEMELTETVGNLEPGTPYRWRARILTDSVVAPHSPWLSVSGGTQGAHLLTAGARAAFPFASVGPAQNMTVFADTPPPVFQWHAGGNASFEIEWAGNAEFADPLVTSGSLSATGNDIETYTPDSTSWLDILRTAQNPDFREAPVFWRINAVGAADSETRALRLAAAAGPVVSSPTDGQTAFIAPAFSWNANHNERFQIRFSASDFLGEPLIIIADDDDSADAAGDFNITGTGITVSDAIWSEVEALVPPGADGTGTVYFAVRGIDALGRPSISEVRSLKVNATGTAAPPPPTGKKRGGGAISLVTLLILCLAYLIRLRNLRVGSISNRGKPCVQ